MIDLTKGEMIVTYHGLSMLLGSKLRMLDDESMPNSFRSWHMNDTEVIQSVMEKLRNEYEIKLSKEGKK